MILIQDIYTIRTNDQTSYGYIDLEHVWNIGGVPYAPDERKRANVYNLERGTIPAGASGSKTTWEGAIGLMYASDYGYSTSSTSSNCDLTMWSWDRYSECYSNSWLYDENMSQWTLTPRSDYTYEVFFVRNLGEVFDDHSILVEGSYVDYTGAYMARPALFLKSNIKIVGGQGTYDEPYTLGI